MDEKPYLSVIIPSYKEGKRIGENLEECEKYFKDKNYSYEILIVVDGSPDDLIGNPRAQPVTKGQGS